MKKLREALDRLWNYRKYKRFKGYETAIQKALLKKDIAQRDREVEQIVLKSMILKHMAKFLNIKAQSRFIPPCIKNEEVCRKEVQAKFGDRMEQLGLYLSNDMKICIR